MKICDGIVRIRRVLFHDGELYCDDHLLKLLIERLSGHEKAQWKTALTVNAISTSPDKSTTKVLVSCRTLTFDLILLREHHGPQTTVHDPVISFLVCHQSRLNVTKQLLQNPDKRTPSTTPESKSVKICCCDSLSKCFFF